MKRTELISQNLNEIIFERCWATENSYKLQLENLEWKSAIAKKQLSNTISDLVFHINYYIHGVLEFLETGNLTIQDKFSFDSPEISSNEDWKSLIDKFWEDAKNLIQHVKNLDDNILDQVFVKSEYGTYQRNFDAMHVHLAYHLAQITAIRKALGASQG